MFSSGIFQKLSEGENQIKTRPSNDNLLTFEGTKRKRNRTVAKCFLTFKKTVKTENFLHSINQIKPNTFFLISFQTSGGPQHIATYGTAFSSLRVLQDLTLDHLNGIPTSNIATLHEDLYFESPLEFKAIEATSLKTEDLISGFDFNYWCDQSLTTMNSGPQKVHKNWTINELHLESDMKGNGLINQIKVDEIVQSIAKSKASTDEVIVGVAKEYQDVCHNIKTMSENAKAGIYFFKYFEQKFELRGSLEGKLLNSRFLHIANEQYILLNTGCMSEIYHWSIAEQNFVKIEEQINTGHVAEVQVFKNESLLILASATKDCDVKGVSLYMMDGLKVIANQSSKDVQSVHLKPHSSTFYGLIDNSRVSEYDSSFQQVEEWLLPETTTDYRFLPFELGIGLALSDGRTIVALTTMRTDVRHKRQLPANINLPLDQFNGNVEYGFGDSETATGEVDFSNDEWRRYEDGSPTVPTVIYHTLNPLKEPVTDIYVDYDYDQYPKLSDTLRQQAVYDLQKTSTVPPDYYDPTISPAWKYLHKETDVIQANIDTHKPKDLPELPSPDETEFQNSFRAVAADVNRKIDILKDMIVTTPINNLIELPNINFAIVSNFDAPFSVVRLGRTPSPNDILDSDAELQNKVEINFGNYMRSEFIKWNEATQNLKDLLLQINEMRKDEGSDPIVEQSPDSTKTEVIAETSERIPSPTSPTKSSLSPLQSTDETVFTNHLRDLVSKWNQKGSDLKTSLQDTKTKEVSDPILTQEQELKEIMLKLPALQSKNEVEFNDQIRGLVAKWNEKVAELKLALDATRTTEKSPEEPIVAQTKVLEDLIQKELPALQYSDERNFVQEIQALVAEWNKKANALETVIKSSKIEKELEPILTKTNELRPFMTKLPSLQSKEEQEFTDQLRAAIGKWNEATSKLKTILESYPNESMVGQGQVLSTTETSVTTTQPKKSPDEQKYSDQMREQISKWDELSQKISEKIGSTTKKPTLVEITIKIPDPVTQEPTLSMTESPVTTTIPAIIKESTQSTFTPTLSSPDDVQMIPDLKKTLFVEQTDSSTTIDPSHRFVPYETTPAPGSDWQISTTEPTVGQAIPVGGVKLMENFYLPAKNKGEIVLMNVGIRGLQRRLVAISSVVNKRSTIPGQHDIIQVIFGKI